MKRLVLSLVAAITLFNIGDAQIAKVPVKKELTPEQSIRLQSVRNVEQWVMGMRDDKILALSLAQIADLAWKTDEEYSRSLLNYSLTRIAPGRSDTDKEVSAKNSVRRRVITLIAKHDSAWAKTLFDAYSKEPKRKASDSIFSAQELIDSDPKAAAELADQSIQTDINIAQASILMRLRTQNPNEADRLYQQLLVRCTQQSDMDANIFARFGEYLFRSPRSEPGGSGTMIRVGDIGMPDLTANIPDMPPDLIRAYLRTAIQIISRLTPNAEQRKVKYALGYMMVPKAQEFAPNLVPEIVAAMASLSTQVPVEYVEGDAYKYLTKKESAPEDRIKEIEKTPDSPTRDQLYLDMALNAARKEKFDTARLAQSKIEEDALKSEVDAVIQFAEVRKALKAKNPDVGEAARMTNKLPESFDKALLWLGIAAAAEKAKDRAATLENLWSARDTANRVGDERCPFLLMHAAGQLKTNGDPLSGIVLGEALKAFNRFENIKDPDFVRPIGLKATGNRYYLDVPGLKISFQDSFFKAVSGDADNAVYAVNDITDERLRGLAYVSLTKILLERKLPSMAAVDGDHVGTVSEDLLRKSAAKIAMPLYPAESLRKKIAGTVVGELQYDAKGYVTDVKILVSPDTSMANSVEDALRQWKFTPRELEANKTAIRGKVTFSFAIDKTGKGAVNNAAPVVR